ncbi:MAG: sigma 54-interacting transcriptional regulator [Candidatus Sedimenticola sp. (ex Thyasira tokunagai)]
MMNRQESVLGGSPEFLRVLHAARMVAVTDAPVLISGESGSGKALLAKEIHNNSRGAEKPFVTILCAGIEEAELEREILAGESGATLFLDQVADLSVEGQARLLHLLESMERGRDGCPVMRVIASTSRDPSGLLESQTFRQDLFYRLQVVPLEVPSLRERSDDIVLMLKQFTADLARSHGRKAPRFSVTSRNLLKEYTWPGNVRELHNFCERMVILYSGNMVQPTDLPLEVRRKSEALSSEGHFLLPAEGIDLLAMEGDMIRQAIGMAGGNRSKAARLLGISRDKLLYRIQKHAI